MKRDKKEANWLQTLRKKPVVFDLTSIETDPNGSYTGLPADPNEKPIQDADDL